MEKQPNSRMCFVCGLENPVGLRMSFYQDDQGRVVTRWTPPEVYQGYPGVLHGGIISTILDEVMVRVAIAQGIWAVTGRMEIRFRKAVPVGEELTAVGEPVRVRQRTVETRAELRLVDGTVAAEATGVYIRVPEEQIQSENVPMGYWQVVPDEEGPPEIEV